jgi:mono/diheme cytochrome c family protein
MQRSVFLGVTFCAFLLTAVPARAEFRHAVENPGEGQQELSDVTTLSGWVFSTTGNPVTVQLFIDNEPSGPLLCCGPRQDIVDGVPGAPLNTSFSALFNIKELAAGDHTLGFEFSATGETSLRVDRNITVVKPGSRSGEPGSSFNFLSDLDTTGANVGVDSTTGEIIIAPTTAVDAESGERDATLKLAWRRSTQAYEIVSAASGTEFAAVQEIFNSRCAVCHNGAGLDLPGVLDLREGQAFRSLVAIKSSEDSTRFRINPGDDEVSYLYQKIIEGGTITGGRMPLGCSGATCLSDSDIQAIENWINTGAAPPQP